MPLFSERDLVLFQDENETRYARVNCAIQPVFTDMEELLQTCFEMNPMHPFLFMNACAKACRKEVLTGTMRSFWSTRIRRWSCTRCLGQGAVSDRAVL